MNDDLLKKIEELIPKFSKSQKKDSNFSFKNKQRKINNKL